MSKLSDAIRTNSRYFIGEIGLNHNGSIEEAKLLIDLASKSGLQAVKFQKRDIDQLAIKNVLDAEDLRFPSFGETYGDIRRHLEFTLEDLTELKFYADKKGLDFFITPFDVPSLRIIEKINLNIIKIASHSVTNLDLLIEISKLDKVKILSTGMCSLEELDVAVKILSATNRDLVILHCVSSYPLIHDHANLSVIDTLKARYQLPIGYSGHEIDLLPTIYAYAKGAKVIERHITLDKSAVGFDHKLSLDEAQLKELLDQLNLIDTLFGDGIKRLNEFEMVTRNKYRVSMVSTCKIPSGTYLTAQHFTWKNPGTGIQRSDMHNYLAKKTRRDIESDVLISPEDFYV